MTQHSELDALPCPLVITDQEGGIVFINECAVTSFELTSPHKIEHIEQLFPLPARIFLQTHLWPMLRANGVIKEMYVKINLADGITLPILLNAQSGHFDEQPCYHWVMLPAAERASFEQELLKARQQLQEYAQEANSNRHLLQTVLDGAEDIAILAVSEHGLVIFANKGAETLFEQQLNNLKDQPIHTLLNPVTPCAELDAWYKTMLSTDIPFSMVNNACVFDTKIHQKHTKAIDIHIQIRKIETEFSTNNIQFIIIISNISQRKEYEALQNNFITIITHELKTPLTSILGGLNILKSGKVGYLSKKSRYLINIALDNSNKLKDLINNIIDFSEIKSISTPMSMQSVFLQPLLENSIEKQQDYANKKQIILLLEGPTENIPVYLDPVRFLKVMATLISNAIKFSTSNTTVKVVFFVENKYVLLRVEDQGIGVSPDFIPYLFAPFRQQDSKTDRRYEGTGLSLAVSKGLIEAMGGEISFLPTQKNGSIFQIKLATSFRSQK
jgi:K+-sensing histidine kinase KdpD